MSVTVLLGAGAVRDLQGATTEQLTKLAVDVLKRKLHHVAEQGDGSAIYQQLLECHGNTYNFEDILAWLEQLYSIQRSGFGTTVLHGVPFTAGMGISAQQFRLGARDIIEEIFHKVVAYVEQFADALNREMGFEGRVGYEAFANFWLAFFRHFPAANAVILNYDTCMELLLEKHGIRYKDGFTDAFPASGLEDAKVWRFDPCTFFLEQDQPKIMHVHGCILYGFVSSNRREERSKDDFRETDGALKKYARPPKHLGGIDFVREELTQDGTYVFHGPMVSGLRKAEKILNVPYDYYNQQFSYSLKENDGLLIIGYSFGDLYINQMLTHFYALHSETERRIVIITMYDKKDVTAFRTEDGFPGERPSSREIRMVSRLMQEEFAARLYQMNGERYEAEAFIQSEDGCVRVYYKGFAEAARHAQDIIEFLGSVHP